MKFTSQLGFLRISALAGAVMLATACGETTTELNAERHLERAGAYEAQGQYRAAIIEYKNALKKSQGDADMLAAYAAMLNDLGHYPSSLQLIDGFQGQSTQALTLAKVDALLSLGKHRSAQQVVDGLSGLSAQQRALLEAKLAAARGEVNRAIEQFDTLIADAELGDEARLGKATLLASLGQYNNAVALLKPVSESSESFARAQLLMAGVDIANNKLENAETRLTDLLGKLPNTDIMRPERAAALERLSYVLTRLGRSNEAYIYSKLLAEAYPGANEVNEQYRAAVEHFKSGDMEAARSLLLGITEKYPSYDKANQLLGIISYLKGETEVASELLSSSVDPEIADPLTTHIYAASRLKLNDPQKVLEILEPGIEKSDAAQTWVLYGLAAISDGQLAKAEKAFNKAVELAPEDVRVRLSLAGFYESTPRADKAKQWKQLETALQLAPTDREVLQQVVSYHLKNSGEKAAERFVNAQVDKYPDAFAPKLIAGYYHASQNRLEQALGYFTQASQLKKQGEDFLNAMFAKGKVELALAKHDAAERTFSELVKEYPASEQAYRGLYSTFIRQKDPAAARDKLEQLARRNAQVAPYVVLVQSALAVQDVKTARKYFNKAQELDKDDERITRLSQSIKYVDAVVAMQQGDLNQARAHIAALLKARPDNLRLLSFLVDLEVKAGALKEARKVVSQIEKLNPDHAVVAVLKGDIAFAEKDMEGAQGHYTAAWNRKPSDLTGEKLFRVLAIQKKETEQGRHLQVWLDKLPNSVPGLLYQSMRLQQRGQRIKAQEGYERLLSLAPENIAALNNLGWIHFEEGDTGKSLKLLERAAQLAPESAAVLDSYGWVLFKHGEQKKGLEYLRRANELAPDNKEIAEHLKQAEAS